ncbi:MAG TPA: isocitrate lyase/phosphoenolpyruvate mutase family protein [Chthoniobacterales bacterium]
MGNAQKTAVADFRQLHDAGCFVLPNPWDIGTAIYLQHLGFKALATTSAGFAFSRGKSDGAVPRDEMLVHIGEVVAATPLPVNADFLNGFAKDPENLAANVTRCLATGVAGLSIEDSTGENDRTLYDENLAIERIRAARSAIDNSQSKVFLTGRCEAFLVDYPNPLPSVLSRLVAYAEAGADCLYAPGISEPEEITDVVRAVSPKPVNVLVTSFNAHLSLAQLADLGVRRISVGAGLALAAWGAFSRSACEIMAEGSFKTLAGSARSAELNDLFSK